MTQKFLAELGIDGDHSGAYSDRWLEPEGEWIESRSPHDGTVIGRVSLATPEQYESIVRASQAAFLEWRSWPAPRRGEVVRQMGEALREKREALGALVTLEMGKIRAEGVGEVQEMIDIADFAVGLSPANSTV